jgi:hypothetical protein
MSKLFSPSRSRLSIILNGYCMHLGIFWDFVYIEAAAAAQKILLVLMDSPAVKQLKSIPNFAARYVFIARLSREAALARWEFRPRRDGRGTN